MTELHRAVEQRRALGAWWTFCTCGLAFRGLSTGGANAVHGLHATGLTPAFSSRPIAEVLHEVHT